MKGFIEVIPQRDGSATIKAANRCVYCGNPATKLSDNSDPVCDDNHKVGERALAISQEQPMNKNEEEMKIKITATYRVDLYDPKTDHWARASEQTEKEVLSLHNLDLSEVLYESSVSDYIEQKKKIGPQTERRIR